MHTLSKMCLFIVWLKEKIHNVFTHSETVCQTVTTVTVTLATTTGRLRRSSASVYVVVAVGGCVELSLPLMFSCITSNMICVRTRTNRTCGPRVVNVLVLLVYILGSTSGLKISGEWRTGDEFFHFLTKFGFQKTSPQDREMTEGFIFGNMTSVIGSSNSSDHQVYGTLALLPRQFFVAFYRNRTKAAADPDLACRLMFQVSLS